MKYFLILKTKVVKIDTTFVSMNCVKGEWKRKVKWLSFPRVEPRIQNGNLKDFFKDISLILDHKKVERVGKNYISHSARTELQIGTNRLIFI